MWYTPWPVPVPLVHRLHTQKSGATPRIGLAAFADSDPRRLEPRNLIAVTRTGSQIVQMRHADLRQPLVLLVAELLVLALQNPPRGRSAQPLVRAVYFRQQGDILGSVPRGEAVPLVRRHPHHTLIPKTADQPRRLRRAHPRHLFHIRPHHGPFLLAQRGVVLGSQHPLHPGVLLASQPNTRLHLVALGHVKVTVPAEVGYETIVWIIGPEGPFGEALLTANRPSETAVALDNAAIVSWTRLEIEQQIEREPRLGIALS
jgi:CRP-like cAMP-binding protein